MSYTGVHQLVRYRLGGKLKVPSPVHAKQESGAVNDLKKTGREPQANFSSCSRDLEYSRDSGLKHLILLRF